MGRLAEPLNTAALGTGEKRRYQESFRRKTTYLVLENYWQYWGGGVNTKRRGSIGIIYFNLNLSSTGYEAVNYCQGSCKAWSARLDEGISNRSKEEGHWMLKESKQRESSMQRDWWGWEVCCVLIRGRACLLCEYRATNLKPFGGDPCTATLWGLLTVTIHLSPKLGRVHFHAWKWQCTLCMTKAYFTYRHVQNGI